MRAGWWAGDRKESMRVGGEGPSPTQQPLPHLCNPPPALVQPSPHPPPAVAARRRHEPRGAAPRARVEPRLSVPGGGPAAAGGRWVWEKVGDGGWEKVGVKWLIVLPRLSLDGSLRAQQRKGQQCSLLLPPPPHCCCYLPADPATSPRAGAGGLGGRLPHDGAHPGRHRALPAVAAGRRPRHRRPLAARGEQHAW